MKRGPCAQDLECAVCLETPKEEVWQCTRGHPFCKTCVSTMTKCPTCRVKMDPRNPVRCLVAEQVRETMDVECEADGCKWRGPKSELSGHKVECMHCRLEDLAVRLQHAEAAAAEEKERQIEKDKIAKLERRYIRITQEKKDWLLNPLPGFEMIWPWPDSPDDRLKGAPERLSALFDSKRYSDPRSSPDLVCGIPGPDGTDWEGGMFPLQIFFSPGYPMDPPKCKFPSGFFHANVYDSGTVSLADARLMPDANWQPCTSISEILLSVQTMLHKENLLSPAQKEAYQVGSKSMIEYRRRVQDQAQQYDREAFCAMAANLKSAHFSKAKFNYLNVSSIPLGPSFLKLRDRPCGWFRDFRNQRKFGAGLAGPAGSGSHGGCPPTRTDTGIAASPTRTDTGTHASPPPRRSVGALMRSDDLAIDLSRR